MTHDKLTIVSVYGHHDGSSAIPAITHSMSELPGARGLLISIAKPDNLPDSIEWRQCERMTYYQYSAFCCHVLASYIDTEFCLIVQDDGWVLQGEAFFPEYYQFDYIGAPTHMAICDVVDSRDWGQLWDGMSDLEAEGIYVSGGVWAQIKPEFRRVVQCGGFSLRSKRLLEAPNKHGFAFRPSFEKPFNEDILLSAVWRRRFEELGYRIAPEEVSRQWAIEHVFPAFHDGFDLGLLVGHHSKTRQLVGPKHIRLNIEQEVVQQILGEPQLLHFLNRHLGYAIEFPDGTWYQPNQETHDEPSDGGL